MTVITQKILESLQSCSNSFTQLPSCAVRRVRSGVYSGSRVTYKSHCESGKQLGFPKAWKNVSYLGFYHFLILFTTALKLINNCCLTEGFSSPLIYI